VLGGLPSTGDPRRQHAKGEHGCESTVRFLQLSGFIPGNQLDRRPMYVLYSFSLSSSD
jgi:hypothetical protein